MKPMPTLPIIITIKYASIGKTESKEEESDE